MKKEKLEKKAITENKILLFYDSYLLDEKSTYSFEDNTIMNIEYFHTVFIYLPATNGGFIYYCRDPELFRNNRSINN